MQTLSKNYNFRFPKNKIKTLYYPSKNDFHTYFSVKFCSREQNECTNVLTFFEHVHHIPEDLQCVVHKADVDDASYIGKLLNMPVVIILDTYCDIDDFDQKYDLYYLQDKQAYKEVC